MLARAVQEHSSSSASLQTKNSGTSTRTLFTTSNDQGTVQKYSTSTTTNSPQYKSLSSPSNPLKRSARQMSSGLGLSESTKSSMKPTANAESVVSKLHESVFWDENDFVDDNDLDLDEEEPPKFIQYPHFPTGSATSSHADTTENNAAAPVYPSLPIQVGSPRKGTVSSGSVPFPWSSSPEHHKALPNTHSIEQDPTEVEAIGNEIQEKENSTPQAAKRRTLPWLKEDTAKERSKGMPDSVKQIIDSRKQKQSRLEKSRVQAHSRGAEPFTPLPKNSNDAVHPWNQTASALKEEQKKHRQKANQGKKLTKSVEEQDGLVIKKQRNKAVARVFLSDEQKKVLDLVVEGKKSVFFTGSAGTGKSVLMREIISVLRRKNKREPDRVAVTASTGLAACNIGGVTLHSFGGIGLGKEDAEELIKKVKRNPKAKNRWLRTRVLIIDEISMVDGALFDKLERIARAIRNNGRPFGGIQLVITGDFFQLPPVPDFGGKATFSFDAATWSTSIEHTFCLTQVFRQKDPGTAPSANK